MNKLITRNLWLQTANVLFELNYIQESKEVLQEVLNQAKVRDISLILSNEISFVFFIVKTYDDQLCEKRACILLGEIALYEHRYDQAIELAMQGQVNNQSS